MSFAIYKPGQGYWTRTMSAIGLAVLVLMGVAWIWNLLDAVKIAAMPTRYLQMIVSLLVMGVMAFLGYYLIGVKPRTVEFLIATESEMKKVNWSNRREIIGSTWVVIGLTAFLAVLTFSFDTLFQLVFKAMSVLK